MQQHHPITRLQVAGFLATAVLLACSVWAALVFALLGNVAISACGLTGAFLAGYLCRVGRRKWNFDAIDAAGSTRLHPSYLYEGELDQAYYQLLQVISHAGPEDWAKMELADKADTRDKVREILERYPVLAEEVAYGPVSEHLRFVAEGYLPEHRLTT